MWFHPLQFHFDDIMQHGLVLCCSCKAMEACVEGIVALTDVMCPPGEWSSSAYFIPINGTEGLHRGAFCKHVTAIATAVCRQLQVTEAMPVLSCDDTIPLLPRSCVIINPALVSVSLPDVTRPYLVKATAAGVRCDMKGCRGCVSGDGTATSGAASCPRVEAAQQWLKLNGRPSLKSTRYKWAKREQKEVDDIRAIEQCRPLYKHGGVLRCCSYNTVRHVPHCHSTGAPHADGHAAEHSDGLAHTCPCYGEEHQPFLSCGMESSEFFREWHGLCTLPTGASCFR